MRHIKYSADKHSGYERRIQVSAFQGCRLQGCYHQDIDLCKEGDWRIKSSVSK